jgi:phage baseplate assembly protein W
MVDVPHFSFPFRMGVEGGFAVVEQDSPDEVVDCVEVLLRTPVGSREDLPEYGIEDPAFENEPDIAGILDAIGDWEPRAPVSDITSDVDDVDEFIQHIRVGIETEGSE